MCAGEARDRGRKGQRSATSSRPLGGTHVLDHLWHGLGIDTAMNRLLAVRKLDPRVERVLFALVANRALDPSSKLAAAMTPAIGRWTG